MQKFFNCTPGITVEVFTESKNPSCPQTNEDVFVVTPKTVAVIDGASAKLETGLVDIEGQTGGLFIAHKTAEALREFCCDGTTLIECVTRYVRLAFKDEQLDVRLKTDPEVRPSASLTQAHLLDDTIVVTQVGDVSFRINGEDWWDNPRLIDTILARQRRDAMRFTEKRSCECSGAECSTEDLLRIGRDVIKPSLLQQVREYQNNPHHFLGHGVIDGQPVPSQFIRVFKFQLQKVQTLEIVSDGYFHRAPEPTIKSWEETFARVEQEDPYKVNKYLGTKGSDPEKGLFADDRTVLIVRFQ